MTRKVMRPQFSEIELIDCLVKKHKCHTIILYGSYAEGTNNGNSDIDLVCFAKTKRPYSDACLWKGIYLDAWVYPEQKLKKASEFLHLEGGRVLLDKGVRGKNLLLRVRRRLKVSPPAMSEEDQNHFRLWAEKMLKRIESDDVEGNYRRHWLLTDILGHYFRCRRLWYRGSKRSFQWLKENDGKAYKVFVRAYRSGAPLKDIKEAVKLACGG